MASCFSDVDGRNVSFSNRSPADLLIDIHVLDPNADVRKKYKDKLCYQPGTVVRIALEGQPEGYALTCGYRALLDKDNGHVSYVLWKQAHTDPCFRTST